MIISFILGGVIGSYITYKYIMSHTVEKMDEWINKELYEYEENNIDNNSNNNNNNKEE